MVENPFGSAFRTLIALGLIVGCVGCSSPTPDDDPLLEALAKNGGDLPNALDAVAKEVVRNSAGEIIEIKFSAYDLTDEGLERLRGLKSLERIDLSFSRITDAGLDHLGELQNLTEVNLASCNRTPFDKLHSEPLTDTAISRIGRLAKLESLNFSGNRLTNAGLEEIGKLVNLRILNVGGGVRGISDDGLKHLAGLSELREIYFGGCYDLTDAGLAHLASLPNLERLNLSTNKISDSGLAHLSKMKKLSYLNLDFCEQIKGEGPETSVRFGTTPRADPRKHKRPRCRNG